MTRLMGSTDRRVVQTLESKLVREGIRSEIRSNPIAHALGYTQLDIFVDEQDLHRASKVRQDLEAMVSAADAAGSPAGGRRINGFVKGEEPELVIEAEVLPSPSNEPPREQRPGRGPEPGGAEREGEFAQATALLEKEVQELLVRGSKLAVRCSSLEEKVKALGDLLAQARADLTREVTNRSSAEKKLAEDCKARASLEKEMQALEVRFKASEQALAASQARLELRKREASDQQARIANLKHEVSSRDAQLEKIAESLTQARAEMEQEKNLRLAAEQKSGDLAAAWESLECQLAQQAQQREQLLRERRDEHKLMRACVGKVNDIRSRVKAMLAAKEK